MESRRVASDLWTPAARRASGLALAGIAAGFLLGRCTAGPGAVEPSPVVDRAEPPDLTPVLAELQRTKAEILESMGRHEASLAQGRQREPAMDPVALDRFESAVRVLAEGLQADRRSRKGLGYANLDLVRARVMSLAHTYAPGGLFPEMRSAHALWTQADLVARYGSPASITDSASGVLLDYDLPAPTGGRVSFLVGENGVIEIFRTAPSASPR